MATYAQLAVLRDDAELRNRVGVAIGVASLPVLSETGTERLHDERLKFALDVLANPTTIAN